MLTPNAACKTLWWTIPFVLILLILGSSTAFDLQFHDTYFVVSSMYLAVLLSILLAVLGGIYWMLRNYKLMNNLSLLHSLITVIAILGIVLVVMIQTWYKTNNFDLFVKLNAVGTMLIGVLLLIQIVFVINIIIGVVKGK